MLDYLLRVEYLGENPFHALLNGHIFMETTGFVSSSQAILAAPFFVEGENCLRIVGGKMSSKGELEGIKLPNMEISISKITSLEGETETQIENFTFNNADGSNADVVTDDDDRESCEILFSSPSKIDNTSFFNDCTKVNAEEDLLDVELQKMQKIAAELHSEFTKSEYDPILEKSRIRILNDAERMEWSYAEIKNLNLNTLQKIKKRGIAYSLESDKQFVFCPSCDGKIWRIGVMESPRAAQELQEAIKMLPAALPPFEYELFQSKFTNNSATCMRTYIASIDGVYSIVR